MAAGNRDYLHEDRFYQFAYGKGYTYYQHDLDDGCDASFSHLLTWDTFPQIGNEILELGCGDGFITSILARRGLRVTGVDCSPTAIARAIETLKDIEPKPTVLVQDICDMVAIKSHTFPYIVDSHCLHCVTDHAHRAEFLKECRRVLAPGGRLFIETMADQPMDWFENHPGANKRFRLHIDDRGCYVMTYETDEAGRRVGHRIWITEAILRDELITAGFDILRFERFRPEDDPNDMDFIVEVT